MEQIIKEGYRVIRISQEDIWNEKTRKEMLKKLKKYIKKKSMDEKILYISKIKELYKEHKYFKINSEL